MTAQSDKRLEKQTKGAPISRRLIGWARILTVFALCGALGWYFFTHSDQLTQLWSMPVWLISAVIASRLCAYLASVESIRQFAGVLAPGLKRLEFLMVCSSGSILGNVSFPWAGYFLKTMYLKSQHALRHRDFFVINLIVGIGSLCVSGVLAFLALFLLQWQGRSFEVILWLIGGAMTASPAVLFASKVRLPRMIRLAPITGTLAAAHMFLGHPAIWTPVTIFLTLRGIFSFVGFGMLFVFLAGPQTSILVGGLVEALSSILRFVNIIPGNLGLYEWIVAALSASVGETLAAGIIAAALFRIAGLIGLGICAFFAVVIHNRRNAVTKRGGTLGAKNP